MAIICPYCEIEISEKMVEAEDGCCPECGTSITALSSGIEEEEEDIYAEEFENSLDDDDFEGSYEDPFDLDDDFFDDPMDDDIPELTLRKNRLAVKQAEEEALANDDVPELTLKSKRKAPAQESAPAPKKGKGKK